jgi:DNA-binding SARP family transcriptional activator
MPRLKVSLFGGLRFVFGGKELGDLAASCRPVLGYLLLQRRRPVTRQEVAGTLWADVDDHRARRSLSTALWRLKQTPGLRHYLVQFPSQDHLSFAWDLPGWLDIVAFDRRIGPYLGMEPTDLDARAVRCLALAADLYQGDLLAGINEEWVLVERQRYQTLYYETLYHLTCAHFAGRRWSQALLYGRRLSVLEPLREDVHRLLMRSYAEMGNRAKAIEQYRICQGELGSELAVEPMEETKALYREIMPGSEQAGTVAPPAARIGATLALAGERVRGVRRALGAADTRLVEALDLIGRAEKASS